MSRVPSASASSSAQSSFIIVLLLAARALYIDGGTLSSFSAVCAGAGALLPGGVFTLLAVPACLPATDLTSTDCQCQCLPIVKQTVGHLILSV